MPIDLSPEPVDEPPISVPKEPKTISLKNVVIGVLIGGIVIGTMAFVASSFIYPNLLNLFLNQTETESTETKTATASANQTTQKDETVDWKTYSSSTYGFSIKYPNNWFYNDTSSYAKQSCEPGADISQGLVLFGSSDLSCVGVVHTSLWDEKVGFVVYSTTKFDPLKAISGEQYTDISVDGQKAVKNFKSVTSEGPRCDCTRIYVNNGTKGFMIEFVNKDLKGSHEATFDEMLSTFNFLD